MSSIFDNNEIKAIKKGKETWCPCTADIRFCLTWNKQYIFKMLVIFSFNHACSIKKIYAQSQNIVLRKKNTICTSELHKCWFFQLRKHTTSIRYTIHKIGQKETCGDCFFIWSIPYGFDKCLLQKQLHVSKIYRLFAINHKNENT